MTTALIALPLVAALVVALVPWSRFWAGSIALLAMLMEVALWVNALGGFDFDQGALQHEDRWDWFGDLEISYHVGLFPFSLWLVGLTVVVNRKSVV